MPFLRVPSGVHSLAQRQLWGHRAGTLTCAPAHGAASPHGHGRHSGLDTGIHPQVEAGWPAHVQTPTPTQPLQLSPGLRAGPARGLHGGRQAGPFLGWRTGRPFPLSIPSTSLHPPGSSYCPVLWPPLGPTLQDKDPASTCPPSPCSAAGLAPTRSLQLLLLHPPWEPPAGWACLSSELLSQTDLTGPVTLVQHPAPQGPDRDTRLAQSFRAEWMEKGGEHGGDRCLPAHLREAVRMLPAPPRENRPSLKAGLEGAAGRRPGVSPTQSPTQRALSAESPPALRFPVLSAEGAGLPQGATRPGAGSGGCCHRQGTGLDTHSP